MRTRGRVRYGTAPHGTLEPEYQVQELAAQSTSKVYSPHEGPGAKVGSYRSS